MRRWLLGRFRWRLLLLYLWCGSSSFLLTLLIGDGSHFKTFRLSLILWHKQVALFSHTASRDSISGRCSVLGCESRTKTSIDHGYARE